LLRNLRGFAEESGILATLFNVKEVANCGAT
jgi:hypothetical protein